MKRLYFTRSLTKSLTILYHHINYNEKLMEKRQNDDKKKHGGNVRIMAKKKKRERKNPEFN